MAEVLLGLELTKTQAAFGAGLPAYRARQVCEALYRRGVASIDEIKVLPAASRADREARLDVGSPMLDRRHKS